jgi:hypothetical protein
MSSHNSISLFLIQGSFQCGFFLHDLDYLSTNIASSNAIASSQNAVFKCVYSVYTILLLDWSFWPPEFWWVFLWIYRFLICSLFPPMYNSVNFQSVVSQYSVNFWHRHDGTFNWIWTTSWEDWVNLQWINNCSLFFLKIKLAFSMYMALSDGIWNLSQIYWNSNHLTVFSVSLLSSHMLSSIAIYFLDLTSISIFMSHEWAFSNAIC